MLEALKLYLNIPKLVFVVGMDKVVLEKAIEAYHKKHEIEGVNPSDYLAKIFQVEIILSPKEKEVDDYMDELLELVKLKGKLSDEKLFGLFRYFIKKTGKSNPREIKRVINNCLISGYGAETIGRKMPNKVRTYTFEQGLQIFFIRQILEDPKYNMSRVIGTKTGDAFFSEWSGIVRKNEGNEDFSYIVDKGILGDYLPDSEKQDFGIKSEDSTELHNEHLATVLADTSSQFYISILDDPGYSDLLILLSDKDLGQLMQIEYSTELAVFTKEAEPTAKKVDDETIIRNAIANELEKEPADLTEKDYDSLYELNLTGKNISDVTSLKRCKNLKQLYLNNTDISDISPLIHLSTLRILYLSNVTISNIPPLDNMPNLVELWLGNNDIIDLSSLKHLTTLRTLSLYNNKIIDISFLTDIISLRKLDLRINQISDITPLQELTNLTKLYLEDNQISDISPLEKLTKLTELLLGSNQISNISALQQLTNLTKLSLHNNQISNISPLSKLKSLKELYLSKTVIVDIEPLKNLTNLVLLDLNNTKVNDLTPIKELNNLTQLYITSTQIDNVTALEKLTNLRLLGFTNTNVGNLKSLKDLNNLDALFFSNTQVKTLEPLKGLKKLRILSFKDTDINDLKPVEELTNLQTLKMQNIPIDNLEPIKSLTNLKELFIDGCKKITDKQIAKLKEALPKLVVSR